MASANETVAAVIAEISNRANDINEDYRHSGDSYLSEWSGDLNEFASRFEAAHNRELSAEQKRCGEILRDQIAEVERAAEKVVAKDAEIEKLRECLKEAVFVMQTLFDKQMPKWRKALEGVK